MEVPAKAVMSPEQQADLLQYMRTGLEWASGDISLDDVMKRLGSPKRRTEFNNDIEYKWFPYNLMTISFAYRKHQAGDETPRINSFEIMLDDAVITNYPYQQIEQLGLDRIVHGEKIDGFRTEQGDFYWPVGVISMSSAFPPNYGTLSYRKRLPEDSPYDLYVTFDYLMELKSERGPWDVTNIIRADNLRRMRIGRSYLTPEDLKTRNQSEF